jgi:GNAT superfamily N-acetyltransferase
MSLTLRPASEGDLSLIAKMNARLIDDEGSRNPMGLVELEHRARGWLEDGSWKIDLFERNGDVTGYAVYQQRRDEYDPEQNVVYIRQFYVERHDRGVGVGTEALSLLFEARFPPGCTVTVEALASNPRGERFWTKSGLVPYARTMVLSRVPGRSSVR